MQLSFNAFYGMIEIPQEGLNTLRIVPVETTAYAVETTIEELPEYAFELSDFKNIEGAAQ